MNDKRTGQQREIDLRLTARMYLEGRTVAEIEIAIEHRVTKKMIWADIATIRDEWREARIDDVGERQLIELARIDQVEANAWDGWERSCRDEVQTITTVGTTTTKIGKSGWQEDTTEPDEVTIKRKAQAGDASFLKIALDCSEKRCRILGLFAPDKLALTKKDGSDLDLDARRNRLTSLLSAVYDRVRIGGDGSSLVSGEAGDAFADGVCEGGNTGQVSGGETPASDPGPHSGNDNGNGRH